MRFPADDAYRMRITEEALKVGRVLCDKGVRSRFSVASDVTLPPPRERDPVGRDRHLA